MTTKEKICKYLKDHSTVKTQDLVKVMGLSRQNIASHLRDLVNKGVIVKIGSTKSSYYKMKAKGHKSNQAIPLTIDLVKEVKKLEEDLVFDEISMRMSLKRKLSSNVYRIAYYSFTEMLNNAIDHSHSKKVWIHVTTEKNVFYFHIRDTGIGLFENIRKKFQLKTELQALEHLLKGKQTTFPERHSGQGIFFTSKIADLFSIQSHKLNLRIDNMLNDIFVGERRSRGGTDVHFSLKCRSKKYLKKVFDHYSDEDYEFDKTTVRIKLSQIQGLLSRSQAKRLIVGLESFKRIEFDFAGVKEIGQSFADEIFRVFKNHNPQLQLAFVNSNSAVSLMIARAMM